MLRVETWIIATLFAMGIVAGMTYLNFLEDPTCAPEDPRAPVAQLPPAESTTADDRTPTTVYQPTDLVDEPDLEQNAALLIGDRYLIAGNYTLALKNYYDFEKTAAKTGSATLLRQALCCEMQKQFGLARQKYYRATTIASNENHQLLGIAGLARCLALEGKRFEALEVLAEQNLKLDQYLEVPEEVRSQLSYQFAKVLESYAIGETEDLTLPQGLAFESVDPKPELFLSVIDQPREGLASNRDLPPRSTIEILQRPSNSLTVITASISAKIEPVPALIGQIAAASQLELMVSQAAGETVQNRAKTIELQAVPLSSVLDTLLVPFDLVWYQVESELHIVARQELDPAISQDQVWFDSAQRAFRRFELTFDDNERRHAALLSRANLNLKQNKFDAAANQYQELTQAQPNDEILAKLFFCQAKLNMLLNRKDEANRFLYLAVDQTLDPDIEASSYCLLGKNLLSQGDLEATIKVSRRGLASAINAKQKQLASLNLSRAYLLNQDPFSANNVLFENHKFHEGSPSKPIASILGAYARYVGVSDENSIRIARNRLLSAVAMIPDSDYESFADSYFAGLAYEQLGFREKAIEKLLLALAKPDLGVWGTQILFEVAILQKRLGQTEEATKTFNSLAAFDETGRWSRLALEQLALIFMESSQSERCIETCRKLWESELDDQQKRTTLQLLGEAYQLKGEHHTAALCFAGMLPDKF